MPPIEEDIDEIEPQDETLPLVHLIHTGGTIASKVDYATGAVTARFDPHELLDAVPELRKIARIRAVKLGNMWSDDIRPRHWNRMLKATEEAFAEGAVGVVITHGTDTLHLSAAAMSYGWSGSGGRPPGRIVLTGSQRSPDRGSSDAPENLISAVYWAANGPQPTGYRDSSVVVTHATSSDGSCTVLPGCACRKYHSSRRDAFKSINQDPIAHVEFGTEGPRIVMEELDPQDARPEAISPAMFDDSVRIAQFVSDGHLHSDIVNSAIELGYDALLFHGTGLGHLPISDPQEDSPENTKLRLLLEDYCEDGGNSGRSSADRARPSSPRRLQQGQGSAVDRDDWQWVSLPPWLCSGEVAFPAIFRQISTICLRWMGQGPLGGESANRP